MVLYKADNENKEIAHQFNAIKCINLKNIKLVFYINSFLLSQ